MAKKTYKHSRAKLINDLNHSASEYNDQLEKLGEVLSELVEAGDVTILIDDLDEGVSRSNIADSADEQANKFYDLLLEAEKIIENMKDHCSNVDTFMDNVTEESTKKKSKKSDKQLQN